MSALDSTGLMGLLAADPATRHAQVQQLLLQRMGGAASGPAPDAPAGAREGPSVQRVIAEATALDAERERASALLEHVALALGGCARCLGTDPACTQCVGAGAPGSRTPNIDRFEQFVAPAARRLVADVEHRLPPTEEPVS
jgi:hypothetical protein